jgi:imidazolonepropionase-like amidohydrolase
LFLSGHRPLIMTRTASITLAALLLLALTACSPKGSGPPTLVLVGATLIDGTGTPAVPDSIVIIEGDRIAAAGPRAQVGVPKDARIINAKDKWLIPGLVDAHVHFFQSGGLYTRPDIIDLRDRVPYEQERRGIRNALPQTFRRYLCSGVTSVVDVGGPMLNFQMRSQAAQAEAAPRVAVAGPLISTVSRDQFGDDPPILRADTPEDARTFVRRQLARNPDLIKIWFIRRPDQTLEEAAAIARTTIEEAHAGGVRVAVHATELDTAKTSVRAGADILVHSVTDQPVDDEFIQLLKENDVVYTTTLVVFEGYQKVFTQQVHLTDIDRGCGDPAIVATWDDLADLPQEQRPGRPARFDRGAEMMRANLRRLQEAGVTIAAGTDAGNIGTLHGPALHREFELMAESGLTPMQILVAATRNAARVFSPNPPFGTIVPGKLADLVLLDADPLADIRNARRIRTVIKGGRVFDHTDLLESSPQN